MSTNNNKPTTLPVPCMRCGAPVARGVGGLIEALKTGKAVATQAYYMHGEHPGACGNVALPGSETAPNGKGRVSVTESARSFRDAVEAATSKALAADGYVRILHVPLPVKAGGAEEAEARRLSAERQASKDAKPAAGAPLHAECLFTKLPSGAWSERGTVSAAVDAAATVSAPSTLPVMPGATAQNAHPTVMYPVAASPAATPAPMAPAPMAPAPMAPMAPPVYITTSMGTVEQVPEATARARLADGTAIGVYLGGAWVTSFPA